MIELSGIPAFVAVAERRSFRAAATALGVTPTAVSKAVARLEGRLGARLLHRSSRHVALTPEGERYLRHCRAALDRLAAGEDELTRAAQVAQGPVALSTSSVLGRAVVRALPRLFARYPRIALSISFSDRAVRLDAEDVDVAIRIGPLADSALVRRRLRTPRWVTVASPAYLARAGEPASVEALAGHACVAFTRPRGGVAPWQFAGGRSLAPPAALRLDRGELIVDAATAGLGIAQAFDFLVEEPLRAGALVEVLAEHAAPGPPMHALTSPGRQAVPRVRALLDFAEELFGRP